MASLGYRYYIVIDVWSWKRKKYLDLFLNIGLVWCVRVLGTPIIVDEFIIVEFVFDTPIIV